MSATLAYQRGELLLAFVARRCLVLPRFAVRRRALRDGLGDFVSHKGAEARKAGWCFIWKAGWHEWAHRGAGFHPALDVSLRGGMGRGCAWCFCPVQGAVFCRKCREKAGWCAVQRVASSVEVGPCSVQQVAASFQRGFAECSGLLQVLQRVGARCSRSLQVLKQVRAACTGPVRAFSGVLQRAGACFKCCSGSVQRAPGRFNIGIASVQRALGRLNTIIPLVFNAFLQRHTCVASLQNAAPVGGETGGKIHHKNTQIKWLKTSYQSPTTRSWPSPRMLRSACAFLIAALQHHN